VSVFNLSGIGFQVRARFNFTQGTGSLNIGHQIMQKGVDRITARLKKMEVRGLIQYVYEKEVLRAINRVNIGKTRLPIYTGGYVLSYINTVLPSDTDIWDVIEALQPSGARAKQGRYAPIEKRAEAAALWGRADDSATKIHPNINTGGALNPRMGIVWSMRFYTGTEHPLYAPRVEDVGWHRRHPYSMRAWQSVFKDAQRHTMPIIKQQIKEALK
jgi:hypothetical protein